ncbi:MAG: O-antigen ligase family protein [Chloroflexi bacterium]|nr:O-antigen ligase family protein [Chloroflexota bacterium]
MNFDFHLKFFFIDRRISVNIRWIQYAIILAVVVISTAAAYWGSRMILIGLVGAVAGIAGFLTLLRYPNVGFLLLFAGGMFLPFAGPGGFNASILTLILMIGLWFMDMFVVKREFKFVNSAPIRPAFYMLIVCVIAFAMGQIPWFVFANQAPLDAQIGGFAIYFFLVLAMIMTANVIREVRWLKIIVWTFIGLGFIYVLGRTLQLEIVDRIYAHGVYANSMFWMWMVTLPLSQAIYNNHLTLRSKAVLYGIVALTFYVALIQQNDWKSGWVPAGLVAAVLVGWKFRKVVPFTIPFVLMVVAYLAQELIATDDYSWGTRVDAWLVVLDISRVSPIIGLGFSNYYWYAQVFSIRGYSIKFNSHSQFVDIIAQTGILGLACFMWILFEIGRMAYRLMNQLPEGFAKAYAYGIFASVFGSLMASFLVDWLLPFAYNIGLDGVRASVLPWIFFGGLIAIEQIYLVNQKTDPASVRERRLRPVR